MKAIRYEIQIPSVDGKNTKILKEIFLPDLCIAVNEHGVFSAGKNRYRGEKRAGIINISKKDADAIQQYLAVNDRIFRKYF